MTDDYGAISVAVDGALQVGIDESRLFDGFETQKKRTTLLTGNLLNISAMKSIGISDFMVL